MNCWLYRLVWLKRGRIANLWRNSRGMDLPLLSKMFSTPSNRVFALYVAILLWLDAQNPWGSGLQVDNILEGGGSASDMFGP